MIKSLRSFLGIGKCIYFDECDYVNPEGYTCNHESDASSHCGIHKAVELRGMVERLKKFDLDPYGTDHDWINWKKK